MPVRLQVANDLHLGGVGIDPGTDGEHHQVKIKGIDIVVDQNHILDPVCETAQRYPWQHEKRIGEELKEHGIILHNHICGNTLPIIDDFIPTGAEILEIDHKTKAQVAKEHARGKATLLGNIDTTLLINGSPGDVKDACREAIEIMGPDYGFILGPGCAMSTETPADNIHALVEAAKEYGTYHLIVKLIRGGY